MIKLVVDEYCHECPEFEPDVNKDKEELVEFDFMARVEKRTMFCNTTVTCQHRDRCAAIYKHAAEQVKEKKR